MKKWLEYNDENSSKFWEIEVIDNIFFVRYGKINSDRKTQEKAFANNEIALKEANKLIAEKMKKGYTENGNNTFITKKNSKNLSPYLNDIYGLDLNWDHSLDDCDINIFPNFCVESIYSIGSTGHNHLVKCILPEVDPQHYPIAIYSEEEGTSKVIAATIETWFPSYLIYRVNNLMEYYWHCEKNGYLDSAEFTIKDLNNILEFRENITAICKDFDNENFLYILPNLFKTIETKSKDQWNYKEYLKIAEKGSVISKYIALEQNSSEVELSQFFIENKTFNAAIFALFKPNTVVKQEIALEVFKRRLNHDFGNSSEIINLIINCANSCNSYISKDSPYKPLLEIIVSKSDNNIIFSDEFFELGKRLKKAELYNEAISAFENAMYFSTGENEEFHFNAFKALKGIAKKINDKAYEKYISKYAKIVKEYEE
ncbi:WGR domain-containing protein, predicted DNA-binding domain in MolR [Flexibacter flexilis DSM 6793]|uniref:WGR domain-containing protein, predicted DNA-binding domain in MolR n=1 Tax=Flexibacter flexilis DSM 6793 TaxID=927664 RepID=A0A1I1DC23_9BACT|nr:WGR domain-containing protein [Flexibacter flexilis]SFB72515.1 WGR domain-containing protein, predicted DNA-binding domain in MolR [Flexibacter flexilis DSM 6793]